MIKPDATLPERVSDASVHLDAIRGIAALVVFLGHGQGLFLSSRLREAFSQKPAETAALSAGTGATPPPAPVPPHVGVTVGHEAVIVFFVLSGYFVGGSVLKAARKGYFSWGKYLFQRLTRLWIVLLPALVLGWALDAGGLHFLESARNIYHAPPGQEYVPPGLPERLTMGTFLGNLFFLQGIFTPLLGTNDSLWSLSYEFWFYIFFPFLVSLLYPSTKLPVRIGAGVAMVGLMALCGAEISKYFVIWLLGAGVALLPLTLPERARRPVAILGLLVFLFALVQIRKNYFEIYVSDLILGAVFSVFLWIVAHARQSTTGFLYRTGAQTMSALSYTLYCVHLPIFVLISALMFPQFQKMPMSVPALMRMGAIYAAVFAVCAVMYFLFERNTEGIRARIQAFWSKPTPAGARSMSSSR
jgi:peptidoglycan/LPS O-acetylase OafA/YrhL